MAFTTANRIHQNYIPELDGLRGIAILLVVTYHYFGGYSGIFSLGWTGVDLFFVLSGYLITSRLMITINDKNYFSKFYKNRALRIMPLYYGVLIFFFIIINLFIAKENLAGFKFYNENIFSFFLFLENWAFIKEPLVYENHLTHFWTLAIEEQFYLIWPLFIYFFSKNKYIIPILVVCIAGIILFRSLLYFKFQNDATEVYFSNTFCRLDSFITGGALYFFSTKFLKNIFKYFFPVLLSIIALGITFFGTKHSTLFMATIGYTTLAMFYGYIIFLAIQKNENHLKVFLKQKWLVTLGKLSYGLYIFHWVVLRFLEGKIAQYLHSHFLIAEQVAILISLIACLIVSILLSAISFFYFEMYFLKMKIPSGK